MFALEVEYLTGWAVATARHKRELAEWPPHPGRLYSALVDAAFQGLSADGHVLTDDIKAALEWLEGLGPPSIAVSEAQRRDVIQAFVPVNDASAPEVKGDKRPSAGQIADALAVLPDGRGKQARFFPTVIPDSPLVHFVWETAPDAEKHRPAVERLAASVTYLGHSSSLVRVAVIEAPAAITYCPSPSGSHTLRVASRGRLAELIAFYRRETRPSPGREERYAKVGDEQTPSRPAESVFGDVIVCEIDGPFLPLTGATRFLGAVRNAVIKATNGESAAVKSLVSGHNSEGGTSREDHVAYIPLANVGFNRHSDGKVLGFGLVLPRKLARFSLERRAILKAVAAVGREVIVVGERQWRFDIPLENVKESLKVGPYVRPAKLWATVTPILCDRFPKEKNGERLLEILEQSIERVVGVRPKHILPDKISRHLGVPPSHEFPNKRKPDDPPRHRTHALIEFDQEVPGPLIVGAGRYHGLGLFRAWKEGRQ